MADPEEIDLPQPENFILTTRREYRDGVERLVRLVQFELRIFDPDLADLDMNTPQKCELLRAFLLRERDNRLYIAVHNTDHIRKYCPRVMNLLRQFSDRIFINQTQDDAAGLQDCFVLADKLHIVRRLVRAQPRGSLKLNDDREGQGMYTRFCEIWESSFPAVAATTVGL